jgi:hypothetical protein
MAGINPMVMGMMFIAMTRNPERRRKMTESILPLTMPVQNPAARAMFTGVVVDQQLRRSEREVEQLATEAVTAVERALAVAAGGRLPAAEIENLPAFNRVVTRLNLRARIV